MAIITAPFAWLIKSLYFLTGNYGLALMFFGLIIALIRWPFDIKSKRSQMKMGLLSPQMNKLKEKYGENTPKYNEELQKFYKEENIKPLGGCLWSLLPIAILMILFPVVRQPLTYLMSLTEAQIAVVGETLAGLGTEIDMASGWSQIYLVQAMYAHFDAIQAALPDATGLFPLNMTFFAGINLGSVPKWNFFLQESWTAQDVMLFLIPVISAITAYFSQKISTATSYQQIDQTQQGTMKAMTLIGPVLSLWIGFTYPAAMNIYWLTQNLANMVITAITNKRLTPEYNALVAERDEKERKKEAELEAKRQETERLKALGITEKNRSTSKKKQQKAEKEKDIQRRAAVKKADLERPDEPSRAGNRHFARGRAYNPDRFIEITDASESTAPAAEPDAIESPADEAPRIDASNAAFDSYAESAYEDDSDWDDTELIEADGSDSEETEA